MSNDSEYDGGTCHCGSAWFHLIPDVDSGMVEALVCVDQRGLITGYAGKLACADCEDAWVSPRERLRIVAAHDEQIPPPPRRLRP